MDDLLVLFAQQNRPPDFGGGAAGACGNIGGLVISYGYLIFLAVSGQGVLNAVSPRNRDMEPGLTWLVLIPCFNFFWIIWMAIKVASSVEKEYADRGMSADGDFGKVLGICAIIPCIGLICGIIWAVKVRGYATQLQSGGRRKRLRDDDDDDDDRPRKKRRRDEDDDD